MNDFYLNENEQKIKEQANVILNEIEKNKALEKSLIASSGIKGTEDLKTLRAKALEGNVVAEYYLTMALKIQGSAPGAGFDYNTLALLKNAADNGFGPAEAEYGQALLNENNTDEALDYLLSAAQKGNSDSITALANIYHEQAKETKTGSEDQLSFLTAAAIWYRVGLESGIEKLALRSYVYDSILNALKNGGMKAAKKKKSSSKSSGSSKSSSGFTFDKRIIILILIIIFLIIFVLVGIFFVVPLIKDLLGLGDGNKEENAGGSNSEISIFAPGLESSDGEFNLDGYEYHFSYDENGNQIIIIGPEGEQIEGSIIESIPTESEIEVEEENKFPAYVITANSGLHLRTEPSTDADSLIIMEKGEIVYLEYMEYGWAKVFYKDLEGYCKEDYIAPYEESDVPEIDTEHMIVDMFVIAKSGLRLRTDPNLDADMIVLMPYGSKVYVYDNSNPEWYFVEHFDKNGTPYSGWCSSEYLDYMEPTTNASTNEENWDNYIVGLFVDNEKGSTLYADHDTSSTIITTIPHGSLVLVYEFGNYNDHNNMNRVSFSFKGYTYYGWTKAKLEISCPIDVWEVTATNGTYLYSSPTDISAKLLTLPKHTKVIRVEGEDSSVKDSESSAYWLKFKYLGSDFDYYGWCLDTDLEQTYGSFNQ